MLARQTIFSISVIVVLAFVSCSKSKQSTAEVGKLVDTATDVELAEMDKLVDTATNKKSEVRDVHRGDRISYGDYTLIVESECLNKKLSSDEYRFTFGSAAKSQQLLFIHGQDTIVVQHPVGRVKLLLEDGSKEDVLENVITQIAVMKGARGSLYHVSGYGGCNSCGEWFGIYTTDGVLLCHTHGGKERYISSSGSYEQVFEDYGIPGDPNSLSVRSDPAFVDYVDYTGCE